MELVRMPPIRAELRTPLRGVLAAGTGSSLLVPQPLPPLAPADVEALTRHGIAPLVYSVTGSAELRAEAIRAATAESFRAADLTDVLDRLARAGVQPLLLKGSALAYQLYERPDLRPRGDTDLLVSASDVPRLRDIMRSAGFSEQLTSGDELGLRQIFFTRQDAPGFRHSYDVHWAVANSPLFEQVLEPARMRASSVPIEPLGPNARGLSPVDALLLACIHRVAHHHDSDRLIWLADIALLRDAMNPEEHREFWLRAAEGMVVTICTRSIGTASEWFLREPHSPASEWLLPEIIAREEASAAFLDPSITYGGVIAANLRALPPAARWQRLRQLALPPADYIAQSFGSRSRLLMPFFYLWRGLRGLFRLFRRIDH